MFKRNLPYVRIGTIGQIKHGKTTLTSVITKVQALKDKALWMRAEDIEFGGHSSVSDIFTRRFPAYYMQYQTDNRHYEHVDMPLHRDIIFNMIIGAAQLDGAILVVSIIDGVMPETREQVELARQIGVPALVVFLNKVDLVHDPELVELAAQEATQLLEAYGYRNAPIVNGSARLAYQSDSTDVDAPEYQPILRLLESVDEWIPTPVRAWEEPFLLRIGDVSSSEKGTIVAGRIEGGQLRKGDEVVLLGLDHEPRRVTAAGIEVFWKAVDLARVREPVDVLLVGTSREEVERGMALAEPGTITPHSKLVALVYNIARSDGGQHKTFFTGDRPSLSFYYYPSNFELLGTILLPEGLERLLPGERAELQVDLVKPLVLERGTRFFILENGHPTCVGVITKFLD